MNLVILIGRLVRDPVINESKSGSKVAKYSLAVERRMKRDSGAPTADFINCTAFGQSADFAEKFLVKGVKIAVTGRIQTGSYMSKDGNKVYTVDVIVDNQEFVESKAASQEAQHKAEMGQLIDVPDGININLGGAKNDITGFMQIPDGIDEELPFT